MQLYPGMAQYGLASAALKPSKLDKLMNGLYYKILSLHGVNRCIVMPRMIILDHFQGLVLSNFVVDYLAEKNDFVQYKWGLDSAAGDSMFHAHTVFLVKIGLYGNMTFQSFERASFLAAKGI